jgi:hypothetical protein
MSERVIPTKCSVTPSDLRRRWPKDLWPWLVTGAVIAVAVFRLRSQGRLWWCACGQCCLWWGDVWSPHNSQHLFDPYSLTHVLHGIVLCGLLAWACSRLAPRWQMCLAICIETLWEVVENTDAVIERYRALTMALDYRGDTIANSLGDILSCVVGIVLARRLGVRGSVAVFLIIELALLIWIRDSLLLNVVMLICPIDAIKAWQLGH